ncbi:MAG: sigma-54 factor interaction domain-containing protein, partial [Rhodospirillales bacterium]|nr:sigma-54 factor interaction domain-containing protein [Rhodospirillales bacterium]
WQGSTSGLAETIGSLNKLLDLDLAMIEDAYQTEFAAQQQRLSKEVFQLRTVLEREQRTIPMVGNSEQMQEVYRLVDRMASTNQPVLIQGESGTGKELVAKALHRASRLADKPLVVINCAALPETLLESELFGHEKGAFTGAVASKPGLFEVADGGTLFVDEIGELALGLQAKLLRVLEDGTLRRVGSVKERRVRVRLIAASNRDLAQEVKDKRFREDLYYRINVLTIQLPPLRHRAGDLPRRVPADLPRHPFALRPGAEGDPRERAARHLPRLQDRPLQADRLRPLRRALRSRRQHQGPGIEHCLADRCSLDDVRRGRADDADRRPRHHLRPGRRRRRHGVIAALPRPARRLGHGRPGRHLRDLRPHLPPRPHRRTRPFAEAATLI